MKIKSQAGNFEPAPEGIHNAVCVDVVDLGMIEGPYGSKHKLNIFWQLEAKMDNGKPFLVTKRYTASTHEKSALRKDLKSWRGKDFTAEEAAEFDLEKIIGANCQLLVQHNESEGRVFANVQAVTKGKTKLVAQDYTRKQDRKDEEPLPDSPPDGISDERPF